MSDPNLPPRARKRRGCLFYGCFSVALLGLLAGLFVVFTTLWFRKQIDAFTDTAPVKLPAVEVSDAEFQALQDRLNSFGDAVQEGRPAQPLVLTEQDINALIARSTNLTWAAGNVYVTLNGGRINGRVSFPIPSNIRFARGRYFNGDVAFDASVENGRLVVKTDDIEAKGRPIPKLFINDLGELNLAGSFNQDPQNIRIFTNLVNIEVQDGKIVVTPRVSQ